MPSSQSVGDHHVDGVVGGPAGLVEQDLGVGRRGPEHHRDAVAAAVEQQADRAVEVGHAVRVPQQRLGAAHPAAGAGGEEQSGDPAHGRATDSMSRRARTTLPDPRATRSSWDQPRVRSSSNSRG